MIADQYGVSVNQLKSSNNISGNMIFPGQVITVNGSSSTGGSGSQETATSGSTYTVKSGDSLAVIAQQNGVTVDQLMKSNNLQGYIIYPGQTLKLLVEAVVILQLLLQITHNLLKQVAINHSMTKTYMTGVNVHITYLIAEHKLVVQSAHTGRC